MQKDQRELFRFMRDHITWNKILYSLHKGCVMNRSPVIPIYILRVQLNDENEDNQDHHSKKNKRSKVTLVKKGGSKKKFSFKTHPEKSSGVTKDDTPLNNNNKKKAKKVISPVNKAITEVIPVKEFDINEPAEDG